jgi:hypothetical protein
VIIVTVVLDVLGGSMLILAALWAVESRQKHTELVQIHRVARSAEWRLQRLGQEALVEMLDAALLLATQPQQPESRP